MARGRPPGLPKTGGRIRGKSLDKGERQLVTSQMAGDIMAVYKKLGGAKWLFEFAEKNPAEFLRQGLSRLFPAPATTKDDEGGSTYNTVNLNLTDREAARRVAYALAKAVYGDPSVAPIDVTTEPPEAVFSPTMWQPQDDELGMLEPDAQRWASEPEAQAPVQEPSTIRSYTGGAGEQSSAPIQRQAIKKSSAADLCRRLSRRGKDLL